MSITPKGRRWEILHSLWIGWTFTLGFFNWIAFFYIGLRAKQLKWILWGLLYSVPFIVQGSVLEPETRDSTLGNLMIALQLILAVVSIVHAFKVRKEYLLRLEFLLRGAVEREADMKRRLHENMKEGTAVAESSSTTPREQDGPDSSERIPALHPRPIHPSPPVQAEARLANVSTTSKRSENAPPSIANPPPVIHSGDELEYQISSSYPFPIAFGFRSLASVVDHRDLYRDQLRIAENILAFLASVSLALLREEDRSRIDPGKYWRSGISPGDWREIVMLCSKVFTDYEDNPLALAIKRLNIQSEKKGFGLDILELIKAKNDYKHDRGPTVLEDIVHASDETQERLKRCIKELAFFIGHPIRQVEDFNVSRRGDEFFLKCLRYTGDHPSFPQEEVIFHKGLPRGDLFLDLGRQDWVLLYPFIVAMTCSHCRARETYFIDMWDQRRGVARMKSFERGHTMSNKGVSAALSEWSGTG